MIKLAYIGPHCSGKTTAVMTTAQALSVLGYKVGVGSEYIRDCPYPINEDGSYISQKWILDMQFIRESILESSDYDYVVMDRCILDPILYSVYLFSIGKITKEEVEALITLAWEYLGKLQMPLLIYCNPLPLDDDGVRSTNAHFQKYIDTMYRIFLKANNIPFLYIDRVE